VTVLQDVLTVALVLGGTVFMLVGSIGINRFPDFYTRAHASGKVDTLGILMFVGGLAVYQGLSLDTVKLLLIGVFVAITSPVASHQLAFRAMLLGLKPWYGRDEERNESE
jgi:multicomponent Na+:H+ antiporter subunit G